MFLLSWIIIFAGLIGCPLIMLASNTLYETFLTSTYTSFPFVRSIFNFVELIFEFNIVGSILSLILTGVYCVFYRICVHIAEAISPSQSGNRYFIFGWLGVFAAFTGIVFAFTCGAESWSFWNGASLKTLHIFYWDIHPILFFNSCICLLMLSGYILAHAPSAKVFFGKKYRSVFYAIHPDFFEKPQVDFSLTYDESQNEFYVFPKKQTIDTKPSYPLLKITYVSSRKSLFSTDHSLRTKELIQYTLNVLEEHKRHETAREVEARKAMKGRMLDNIPDEDLMAIRNIVYSKNSRDFIVLHGRILYHWENFKCSDVLQIHIDDITSKVTISKNTYLCKCITKALENTSVSLEGLPELRIYLQEI